MIQSLRHPFCRRIVSALLFLTLWIGLVPHELLALTHGPHQPEYTAFEEPGGTDLVNLTTGDFSMSLPGIDVPSPEGTFSVPLAYHAGIGLEQQASWVGLGWSLNAGAITRNIDEFPDDASGEISSVTAQDLTGVRGWSSSLLGLGNIGWNTDIGHYGSVSLLSLISYSYGPGGSSVGIAGVNISSKEVTFSPVSFSMAVISVVSMAGGGAFSSQAQFGLDAATDIGVGALFSTLSSAAVPTAPLAGAWKYQKKTKQKFLHKEYKIWLNQTRSENMYGLLYLGAVPYQNYTQGSTTLSVVANGVNQNLQEFKKNSATSGAATDMSYEINDDYEEINNPSFLAHDDFSVKASGVTGNIRPYRFDIGSVGVPRDMTYKHNRFAPIKFLNTYKVPFLYSGTLSSNYFHHVGAATTQGNVSSPTPFIGISHTLGDSRPLHNTSITYNFNDYIFGQRLRSDLGNFSTTRNVFPSSNHVEWLSNGEIKSNTTFAQTKFIDFLSATGGTSSPRYLFRNDFTFGALYTATTTASLQPSGASTFVLSVDPSFASKITPSDFLTLSLNVWNNQSEQESGASPIIAELTGVDVTVVGATTITVNSGSLNQYIGKVVDFYITANKSPKPAHGIGGFSITASTGITYHFALPVYDYSMKSEIINKDDPNKRFIIKRDPAFANTWLLTAITGSDFIDRNGDGLVGTEDWGYWVKFNYGKHRDDYEWRIPRSGFKRDAEDKNNVYSYGKKQTYYLNSIETRSHIALFLKSDRLDGKGAGNQILLKLDEIAIVTREVYNNFLGAPYNLPNYSNQITNICRSSNVSGFRDHFNRNASKRVVFTYDANYILCKNATSAGVGKLTLNKVSYYGRNNQKLVPDYKFDYANNPNYNSEDWDGWGFYNPGGTSSGTTHEASTTDSHGSAWSMTKITTPLGSSINVSYERDTYSKIGSSNLSLVEKSFYAGGSINFGQPITQLTVDNIQGFQVGNSVTVSGTLSYTCPAKGFQYTQTVYPSNFTIVSINGNTVGLNASYATPYKCGTTSDVQISYSINGTVSLSGGGVAKKGGDIRVAAITMEDALGQATKMRYLYHDANGNSYGVVSKEPDYIRKIYYAHYDLPYYPSTPVMYSKVVALNGKLTSDGDYHTKTTYEFDTPNNAMVANGGTTEDEMISYTQTKIFPTVGNSSLVTIGFPPVSEYLSVVSHVIVDNTARIGSLRSVKVEDKQGTLVSSTTMEYTSNNITNDQNINHQGVFSQGSILMEKVVTDQVNHKLSRTTVIEYPYTLKSVTNVKDNQTSKTTNLSWDFLSGNVTKRLEQSNLGFYIKTITIPAFRRYSSLGVKALNINNKHVLNVDAETYIYKSDGSGQHLGLIGATATTWLSDNATSYRVYNSTGGNYSDGRESESASNPIWRQASSYVWEGSANRLQKDGTHSFYTTDEFNHSGVGNSLWQKIGDITRYDHFSKPLETKDQKNIYSSKRLGYDNQMVIAEAVNASQYEIAFSGAEDKITSIPYFGSEVRVGDGIIQRKSTGSTTITHTGDAVVQVGTNQKTFIYSASTGLKARSYRVSVLTNNTNGRIYYRLNGGAEQSSSAPITSQKAGDWYLLNMTIPLSAVPSSFEVGVKSINGNVKFDDFRFQPEDAIMTTYVSEPPDYIFQSSTVPGYYHTSSWVLDNDNLYTRYQYNERGELVKVYRESMLYNGEKLIQENATNFRRFTIDQ